ncbi:hypothetical protein GPECTOR_3g362 [Gonium pectorale]|uniref:Uncharacterized protein n=1 Tax=Gonium pectorale TaxID=33097 RepID=A0A150H0Y0_GONPE|nr:hypothetical protein GPECTOR_3g362 [Gonium pectorale]|eukprot:KXZ55220.1 hypothetical protein GPECTOR_3g362 [Gonium pectorale]
MARRRDQAQRAALAALASAVPRVVSSYAAGRPPDPELLQRCRSAVKDYCGKVVIDSAAGAQALSAVLHSKLADLLLQLLTHSGREAFGPGGDIQAPPTALQPAYAEANRKLWEATHDLISCSLTILGVSSIDAPTRCAVEAFILKFLRTGTLRSCSRALAEPALQRERGAIPAAGLLIQNLLDYFEQSGLAVDALQCAALAVGSLASFIKQCSPAAAAPSNGEYEPGGGGGALCRALVTELLASGVLDHVARRVVLDLISGGGDSAAADGGGGSGAEAATGTAIPSACRGGMGAVRTATSGAFTMLTTAAEAFARATASNGGAIATVLPPPTQPLTPPWGPCAQYLTLAVVVTTLAAAGYGGGCDGGGGEGAGDGGEDEADRNAIVTQPVEPPGGSGGVGDRAGRGSAADSGWSFPGLEAERMFAVLLSMVEAEADRTAAATRPPAHPGGSGSDWDAGDGGGIGGGGADGAVDGGAAFGGWSFLVGPRAAHVLCMRIAHLAVETGEAAAAATPATAGNAGAGSASGGGGRSSLHPQPQPLRHPRGAWHLAARALAAAQNLLLGPLMARRRRRTSGGCNAAAAAAEAATAAVGNDGPLPACYWETVVRALRVPVVASAAPASSPAAGAPDGCDLASIGRLPGAGLGGMMAVPGLGAGGPLPAEAPAALATALSCGLLPALECCVRTLGRSADPRDVGSLCELLRGSLLEQPGGLVAVLAFGPPEQAAPLLTSLGKVLHRCAEAVEAVTNAMTAVEAGPSRQPTRLRLYLVLQDYSANLAALAVLMGRAQSAVWTDPWVAHVAGSTPAVGGIDPVLTAAGISFGPAPAATAAAAPAPEVPPQLLQLRRQLPLLLLQRWLPALARAVAVAPCLLGQYKSATYGAAQDSLSGLAVALFASARPPMLKAQMSRACLVHAVADRWRQWLDANFEFSPALMLCDVLVDMPTLRWDAARVRALLDFLLAAAITQPGYDPELLFIEQRFQEVQSLSCVRADRALSEYSIHVFLAVRGTCALDLNGFKTGVGSALYDGGAVALIRLAASLEPPAGEGPEPPAEGLPPACANPRCTNLAGESDAGLMAAEAEGGGGGGGGGGFRDGGGNDGDVGGSRVCGCDGGGACSDGGDDGSGCGGSGSSGGRRVPLWCSAECQRANDGRSTE